ncbi:hypothetical protein ANCDUO_06325 [Ancylostoma duodenale]|uniref:Uncharacterized protein n=1 Tax=Ancylostoma duodenale TaxID=51022 RepID=A0A0C2GPX2_9BILA|nr:hypothetical protein ANCDUO_06325 [Ancylostoma duodenale]
MARLPQVLKTKRKPESKSRKPFPCLRLLAFVGCLMRTVNNALPVLLLSLLFADVTTAVRVCNLCFLHRMNPFGNCAPGAQSTSAEVRTNPAPRS